VDHSTVVARPDGLETPAKSVSPFFFFLTLLSIILTGRCCLLYTNSFEFSKEKNVKKKIKNKMETKNIRWEERTSKFPAVRDRSKKKEQFSRGFRVGCFVVGRKL
jgi:hypothetical protein